MKAYFIELLGTSFFCGVLILVISLVSLPLKKSYTVFWRYLLWIALAVRLLLPFDFSVPKPVLTLPAPVFVQQKIEEEKAFSVFETEKMEGENVPEKDKKSGQMKEKKEETEEYQAKNQSRSTGKPEELRKEKDSFELWDILFFIWAGVAALLALFQIFSYWKFFKKADQTKVYLKKEGRIPVFVSPLVQSPMLLGIGRPRILLPERSYGKEELSFIINHEIIHDKRKDLLVKLLLGSARTLHWFNPLVYLMEKRAAEDMELLCDSQVVREFTKEEKKHYSEMLLECAAQRKDGRNPLFASEFSKETKTLRERFANIFNGQGKKKGIFAAVLGIGIILFASLFVAFSSEKKEHPITADQTEAPETSKPSAREDENRITRLPELSIEEAATAIYGAVFPQLAYVSSRRAILYDYWGMLIYHVEKQEIEQILNLPAAGFEFVQGEDAVHIEVSQDGGQVLLYKESKEKNGYVYFIDEKRLEPWDGVEFKGGFAKVPETVCLTGDSLLKEDGGEFHTGDMQSLSLVISDRSRGAAAIYPIFREFYEARGEQAISVYFWKDIRRRVVGAEYLYQDEEGWKYYLEEDIKKESRLKEIDGMLLLVRYRGEERQVLEDLMTQEMWAECPVIFADGRIVYKAAPTASTIGIKDPVMVSLAMDGSDRKTADDMLYHTFRSMCEDEGWIYYTGWTNDGVFPQPLCRIPADFSSGPKLVAELPGFLCGVKNGYVFYLADETKKPGIWRLNLKTGEEQIYDKMGRSANELSLFYAWETWLEPEMEGGEGKDGCHMIYSACDGKDFERFYFCNLPFSVD